MEEFEEKDWQTLVLRLRSGIKIKERSSSLKYYKMCFKGNHAVAWVMANTDVRSEKDAVALLNAMMDKGYLHHVTRSYKIENKVRERG